MKHPHRPEPSGPRSRDDTLDLEEAFELLLRGEGSATPPPMPPDLRAEFIAHHQCTYCDQPAQVSRFDLSGQQRTLLCGVCRPPGG